jgi:hypothetical protein
MRCDTAVDAAGHLGGPAVLREAGGAQIEGKQRDCPEEGPIERERERGRVFGEDVAREGHAAYVYLVNEKHGMGEQQTDKGSAGLGVETRVGDSVSGWRRLNNSGGLTQSTD